MNTILKVFKNEFKMYTRDKKLLVNTLLLPILIYPLIIAIVALGAFISMKSDVQGIKVSFQGKNLEVMEAMKKTKGIKIIDDRVYSDSDILDRTVDAIIVLSEDKDKVIQIKYDSTKKSFLFDKITDSIQKLKVDYITSVLKGKGLKYDNINPISFKTLNEKGKTMDSFTMVISLVLPMLFLLFPMISTSYLTTDIAAGEKEKNTLEPLLCTKTSRYKILLGKLLFTSIISVIISIISILVLGLAAIAAISAFNVSISSMSISFSGIGFMISLIIIMLTVIFLSALQLTLSFFAKNYKESQMLVSPLLIIIMVPIFMSMFLPDKSIFYHLPIFNVVLILKQLTAGIINFANVSIVIGWLVIYIIISVLLCIKAINSEKFIFRV
ncbi:ABC transporter permease [Clostridium estertheticum]|uniref:ABC transporter permease n=1 Tax=Clostridium estertheticum TaxID=238834 RepID=UPI0013E902F3|nr:ABC transporter permease [Clostridium estertheticum]MBZ9686607.1 ABC transporter permease [Clostridium estertheticum]